MKKDLVSNDNREADSQPLQGKNPEFTVDLETEYMTSLLSQKDTFPMDPEEAKIFTAGEIIHGLYQVQRILGEGGMGRVYLCLNLRLGNLWAVKHIPSKLIKVPSFRAEENILKRLNHPYLPKIIDRFEDGTGIYIVESYIEGISLNKKLELEGPFSEVDVIPWALQLTDALSYLHSLKPYPIIYQDMKPSNVIITPENKAIIIDFGVSTEYMDKGNPNEMTIGVTAAFAAPEQYKGKGDQRSDIYNLGVMLYYLMTKGLPFQWDDSDSGLSKTMEGIIKKCLMEAPKDRYQSMEELKTALTQHHLGLRGVPVKEVIKHIYTVPKDYKKLILLISPESTGKTTVAVNLAYMLSQQEIKTILIDGDMKKKDVYYHFDHDYSGCMEGISAENFLRRGREINPYLSVYSEHRDVDVQLEYEKLLTLLPIAKFNAQITIVDLGADFPIEELNRLISLADQILMVVDQRISLLNRLQQFLPLLEYQNKGLDVVINRYIEGACIDVKQLKSICRKIVTEEAVYRIPLENIFTLPDDYCSIVKGLFERRPALQIKGNILAEGLEKIAQSCYPREVERQNGLFGRISKIFRFFNED